LPNNTIAGISVVFMADRASLGPNARHRTSPLIIPVNHPQKRDRCLKGRHAFCVAVSLLKQSANGENSIRKAKMIDKELTDALGSHPLFSVYPQCDPGADRLRSAHATGGIQSVSAIGDEPGATNAATTATTTR
jgi:hypothetical protein